MKRVYDDKIIVWLIVLVSGCFWLNKTYLNDKGSVSVGILSIMFSDIENNNPILSVASI